MRRLVFFGFCYGHSVFMDIRKHRNIRGSKRTKGGVMAGQVMLRYTFHINYEFDVDIPKYGSHVPDEPDERATQEAIRHFGRHLHGNEFEITAVAEIETFDE